MARDWSKAKTKRRGNILFLKLEFYAVFVVRLFPIWPGCSKEMESWARSKIFERANRAEGGEEELIPFGDWEERRRKRRRKMERVYMTDNETNEANPIWRSRPFSRDIGWSGEDGRKGRKGIRKFSRCSSEFDWVRPFLIQPAGTHGPLFSSRRRCRPFYDV